MERSEAKLEVYDDVNSFGVYWKLFNFDIKL